MVLIFEDKTYESVGSRIMYAFFKMNFVSQKYLFCYNPFFLLNKLIEFIFTVYLLTVNNTDFANQDIKDYGNFYNHAFNPGKFNYTNYDQEMGFFINFIDIPNKFSLSNYTATIGFLLFIIFMKLFQLCYFMRSKVKIIKVSGWRKCLFLYFSFIDQFLKILGQFLILLICLSVFACQNGKNIFLAVECYSGQHLILTILVSVILVMTFINFISQILFYDPGNLIDQKNFGIMNNIDKDFIKFLAEFELVLLNVISISTNQEIIKVAIFLATCLLMLYFINNTICKFNNFNCNIVLFKTSASLVYSLIFLIYLLLKLKITVLMFLLMVFTSSMIGYLIMKWIKHNKTHSLYARVNFNIF
jgi:hypothetical protein